MPLRTRWAHRLTMGLVCLGLLWRGGFSGPAPTCALDGSLQRTPDIAQRQLSLELDCISYRQMLLQLPSRPASILSSRRSVVTRAMSSFYDLSANDISGKPMNFSDLKGKVVLITNVASACGYTDRNYKDLVALYEANKDKGLVVMGFPCNQFGAQESGSPDEIKQFCETKYRVTFPIMEKVDVNGPRTSPVYSWLKAASGNSADVRWNFATKFIVSKDGKVERIDDGQVGSSAARVAALL